MKILQCISIGLACLVALVTAGFAPVPEVTLQSLGQEAQELANTIVSVITQVNSLIPAYITAANNLNNAADLLGGLDTAIADITEKKNEAKDLSGTDSTERRETMDRIQELRSAVQTTRNRLNIIAHRTGADVLNLIEDAVELLNEQKDVVSAGTSLPDYYTHLGDYNGHSYYIIPHSLRLIMQEARADCQQYGMDLIGLETAEEHQWLKDNWEEPYGGYQLFWSGAYEQTISSPRQFIWVISGQDIEMSRAGLWTGTEPNSANMQCVRFADNLTMADSLCEPTRRGYICETA